MRADEEMDDLDRFIEEQKRLHPEFAEGFDEGYENFKIGVLLQLSREQAELTQEEVAQKMEQIRYLPHRKPRREYYSSNPEKICESVG